MSEEMMEGADLITLVDEDGQEHEFEIIDSVEQPDGSEYVALVPVMGDDDPEAEDNGELIILKVVQEEDGEEVLEAVEDDDEFERIGEVFKERLKDAFDFED
ncbi:MAG: DUF1292 domain-containing protein [Oscillospiraceae bacterium]|nr:DUF1292 domain-containing protein [Oscillospiraceae bacterium]